MKNIAGTFTETNLLRAFAGESQARNRYTYFASQARKEGFMQIADIFAETADQEKEHAERFFKYLTGGEVEIRASFPAGCIGTTVENLAAAAAGEYEEWNNLYPSFSETAREEGFNDIARCFEFICVSERQHERRYRALLKNITSGTVFAREREVMWRCRNCGYLHYGKSVPEQCPACLHEKGYFELLAENW
ncbi:MAG: rubrerythrin family protein [Lentisphaeria bacterium]|nr:rubrerythrin family protein [Lentisphaeria bacterium]